MQRRKKAPTTRTHKTTGIEDPQKSNKLSFLFVGTFLGVFLFSHCWTKFAGEITPSVRKFEWKPGKPFADICVQQNTPMVLTKTVIDTWPARKRWTPTYFAKHVPKFTGIYRSTQNRFFGPYYNPSKPLHALGHTKWSNPYEQDVSMPGSDFIARVLKPKPGEYLYYSGEIERLGDLQYDVEPLDEMIRLRPDHTSINVWIGQQGVVAPFHYDGFYNMYAQLYGRKRFLLYPPGDAAHMHVYPFLHPSHAQSQINITNSDSPREQKLLADRGPPIEVVLEPGDLLYLPPLWFHQVEALEPSISVNAWTLTPQSEVTSDLFAVPLPSAIVGSRRTSAAEVVTVDDVPREDEATERTRGLMGLVVLRLLLNGLERTSASRFVDMVVRTRYHALQAAHKLPSPQRKWLRSGSSLFCDVPAIRELWKQRSEWEMLEYTRKARAFISEYPLDTRDLWLGNYIEYVAANNVGVVDAGWYLKAVAMCLSDPSVFSLHE